MIVLESLERARFRGARIHAEIIGYGVSSDAAHLTQPQAEGQAEAMRRALLDASIRPGDVDYINAHGTATSLNDKVECQAIRMVFDDLPVPVSATKSMHGHLMGGTGAVESILTLMACRHGIIPPTINVRTIDPECNVNVVANTPLKQDVRIALKNSFAFGGNNSVLVFRSYDQ